VKALVTGATGFIGRELCRRLSDPAVLTRSARGGRAQLDVPHRAWSWHAEAEPAPREALSGVDTIFHLAGEPIAEGRWSDDKKKRIRDSRVLGTRNLVRGIAALDVRPRVLISMSAIGFYGDRGEEELDEAAVRGEGFLPDVCEAWEAEARQAENAGVRVVTARLGIVISDKGGALPRMLLPFRLGVGGRLGSGRQWMSWVHLDDAVGLLLHAASSDHVRGPVNVVSPSPVTNEAFTTQLAQALHRPALLPVPRLALRVALGEVSGALLESQRVLPCVARETHYAFVYPELATALAACLRKGVSP
jgi:hypothetical protein